MSNLFLIADDTPGKVMMLRGMLRQHQWDGEVLVAETTEQATEIIDAHPDIGYAFIDYYMPSDNGPAVIRYLKEKNPAARIALVSSADNAANAEEARQTGAETSICTTWPQDQVRSAFSTLIEEWKTSL